MAIKPSTANSTISVDSLVSRYIGTSYDTVLSVAQNLTTVQAVYDAIIADSLLGLGDIATEVPEPLGTAAIGSAATYAAGNHVHSDVIPATGVLTDGVTGTTQALDDSTTKIATTAFVLNQAGDTTPEALGTASAGSSESYSRKDHIHTDAIPATAVLANGVTGTTQAAGESSTKIATTQHVTDKIADLNLYAFKGTMSVPANYPAGDAGDIWVITGSDGIIGGTGPTLEAGDTLLCVLDSTTTGNHADKGSSWVIGQANLNPDLYALLTGATFSGDVNIASGLDYKINNVSVLNATTLGSSVVNSSLTTFGTVEDIVMANGGTIGQATGPLLTFDGTNNLLTIGSTSATPGVLRLANGTSNIGSSGIETLDKDMQGLELVAGTMNTSTYQYGSALKFMSNDLQFTTENPKFLAGIIPRATEGYATDTDGGMALDFAVTADNPGATNVPVIGMSLTSTGLGIGTASPDNRLHVYNTTGTVAKFSNNQTGCTITLFDATTTGTGLGVEARGNILTFRTSGTSLLSLSGTTTVFNESGAYTDFRIESYTNEYAFYMNGATGNVGIGTASPAVPFHAYHATDNILARFESGDADCKIQFRDSGSGVQLSAIGCYEDIFIMSTGGAVATEMLRGTTAGVTFNNSSANVDFMIKSYVNTAFFMDGATGNVGIGTASPDTLLHIVTTSSSGFKVERTGVPSRIEAQFASGNSNFKFTVNDARSYAVGLDDGDGDKFKISYGPSDNAVFGTNDIITVDGSNGNVGIGTASPTQLLDVQSSTATASIQVKSTFGAARVYINAETSSVSNLLFKSGVSDTGKIIVESTGVMTIYTGGATAAMTLNASQDVTIPNLAGTGTRNVVVDANGKLSAP